MKKEKLFYTTGLEDAELMKLLEKKENGDDDARNKIVEAYLFLAHETAKSSLFALAPIENEDLVSAGFIGLLKGVDSYKSGCNVDFVKHIESSITKEMFDACSLSATRPNVVSLDEIREKEFDGCPKARFYDNADMDTKIEKDSVINLVRTIIERMTPNYRQILELYFGFETDAGMNSKEISKELHLPIEYVERVIKISTKNIKLLIGRNGQRKLYGNTEIDTYLEEEKTNRI